MKKIVKALAASLLALLARAVVCRYRPKVVMVTGSVGKTSTKDAVAAILSTRFYLRKSKKSFNGEFGVPYTILDIGDLLTDPFEWLRLAKNSLALLLLPNHYPNMLVLEVGADKPGEIAHILRIVTPDAVVVTKLPEIPVHVEAYPTPEAVREEEFSPALALAPGAPLILSADDPYALDYAVRSLGRVVSYGGAAGATVHVGATYFYHEAGKVAGMQAQVRIGDIEQPVVVKGSVGGAQLLPAAAALATATVLGIMPEEAFAALASYEPPPGRGRLLAGRDGAVLIDDSYNSSPAAVEEALATLKTFPGVTRRVAILGDMLELGRYSVMEHSRIAEEVGRSADLIVTVGIRARAFASAPGAATVLHYDTAKSAAAALAKEIGEGDVILVKGSQSVRMERIVEALLANRGDRSLLVRQEKKWKQKA